MMDIPKPACGLAVHPATYDPVRAGGGRNDLLRRAALAIIGAGVGCDALGDDEQGNEAGERRLQTAFDLRTVEMVAAIKVWDL